MEITCWGTRGSLPTPGAKFQRYGGNTTCFEIRTISNNLIILDAGTGIRGLGKKILKEKEIKEINLYLTHAHWDHLLGFPFFTPAYFSKYKINVFGGRYAKTSLQKYLKHQMEPPYFPVDFNLLKANFDFAGEDISNLLNDDIKIEEINLNHPDGGFGYKFIENNKTLVFLTDNELDYHHKDGPGFDDFVEFCKDADILLHDAQYTNDEYKKTIGWGHSTFESAVKLAVAANVKKLGFCHHDPDRIDSELDEIVEKYRTTLECFAVAEGQTYKL